MSMLNRTLVAALIAGGAASFADSANAVPLAASLSLRGAATSEVQTVQWRRWGWGGLGFGLAAGAIAGAALASSPYYGYGGYGYGYGYPAYSYGYGYPAYGYGYGGGYYRPAYRPAVYGGYRVARRVAIHRARWR